MNFFANVQFWLGLSRGTADSENQCTGNPTSLYLNLLTKEAFHELCYATEFLVA